MTADEREFRLGKSVMFGELLHESENTYEVKPIGAKNGNRLSKDDGWEIQPLPFVFPTKRNAIVGIGNNRFILVSNRGRFWYRPGQTHALTEEEMLAGYMGNGWFVVFEGEDQ